MRKDNELHRCDLAAVIAEESKGYSPIGQPDCTGGAIRNPIIFAVLAAIFLVIGLEWMR